MQKHQCWALASPKYWWIILHKPTCLALLMMTFNEGCYISQGPYQYSCSLSQEANAWNTQGSKQVAREVYDAGACLCKPCLGTLRPGSDPKWAQSGTYLLGGPADSAGVNTSSAPVSRANHRLGLNLKFEKHGITHVSEIEEDNKSVVKVFGSSFLCCYLPMTEIHKGHVQGWSLQESVF